MKFSFGENDLNLDKNIKSSSIADACKKFSQNFCKYMHMQNAERSGAERSQVVVIFNMQQNKQFSF